MKIVIIGLGTIGKTILKNLSGEEHTVTIIDEDKKRIENLIEKVDTILIGGGMAYTFIKAIGGSISITATAAYNGIAETDTKTVTVTKENDKVIVDLTVLSSMDLLVVVAGYETSGRMAECKYLDDNHSADVIGDVIRVFFLDENYVPVLPKVTLD